ncbi:hypothetical protein [uncultured Polaribacter sp.]|uniref:hypothetical protein n=1 Tax=uncultured Polaribacter sp. TaxID=174711 RepID=UPI002628BE6B|nr:hypothetical protein [uncultured Polaribacter sp.]
MKRSFSLLALLFSFFLTNSQEKKKDTLVKTEVVNVVTKYNPKITDVNKIKENPTIQLLDNTKKKKLKYNIFSAPVASTFIPKTGVVKGINLGVKERIYKNYIAAGFGNYISPFADVFIYNNNRFNSEFGFSAKYNASLQNIENTLLNSTFTNLSVGAFYKKEARYFNWKVNADAVSSAYNWYGLPENNYTDLVLNSINEVQKYNLAKLSTTFNFYDSYIDYGKLNLSFFSDDFNSQEILADFNTKLSFPLDFLGYNVNEISVITSFEYLGGNFQKNYANTNKVNYTQLTAKINPTYQLDYTNLKLKVGFKTFYAIDSENNINNLLIFPDVLSKITIFKKYINAYAGVTGNLHSNTYQQFTEENPFVSPTLFITQTAETANFFAGLKGNITNYLSYHIKAAKITEEDKPLFLRNNSKSDGTTSIVNNKSLEGYEYGNSFGVFYDDVETTHFLTEIEYFFNKNLTLTAQVNYNNYNTTNALDSFNLPELEGAFLAKYKAKKWFANATIYYVDSRKDIVYNATFPSSINSLNTLDAFVDVNLNGGYHFNDKFSAFLRLNNVLNNNYQRFTNFNVQGFQALGGFTYKFDF